MKVLTSSGSSSLSHDDDDDDDDDDGTSGSSHVQVSGTPRIWMIHIRLAR